MSAFRPQTQQTKSRANLKPTERLLSAHHLRNYEKRIFTVNQEIVDDGKRIPQVEQLFTRYLPTARNFGHVCDRAYQENTKQHQKQKFGRAVDLAKIPEKLKRVASAQVTSLKKPVISLDGILNSSSLKSPRETSFRDLIRSAQNDEHLIDQRTKFSQVYHQKDCVFLIQYKTMKIEYLDPQNKRKTIPAHQKLFLPFDVLKKILLLPRDVMLQLLEQGLQIEAGRLKINYAIFDSLQIFGEDDNLDHNEHLLHSGLFRVTLPSLELYRQDTQQTQVITTLQRDLLELLVKNFSCLQKYNNLIHEAATFLVEHGSPFAHLLLKPLPKEEKFDLDKKILKLTHKVGQKYITINFRPSWFELRSDTDEILASRYLSFEELEKFIRYLLHHNLELFLSKQLLIQASGRFSQKSQTPRMNLEITFVVEGEERKKLVTNPLPQQIVFECERKGFFKEKEIMNSGFRAIYFPPILELYDPVSAEKLTKVISENQMQYVLEEQLKFTIDLKQNAEISFEN